MPEDHLAVAAHYLFRRKSCKKKSACKRRNSCRHTARELEKNFSRERLCTRFHPWCLTSKIFSPFRLMREFFLCSFIFLSTQLNLSENFDALPKVHRMSFSFCLRWFNQQIWISRSGRSTNLKNFQLRKRQRALTKCKVTRRRAFCTKPLPSYDDMHNKENFCNVLEFSGSTY